MDRESFYKKVGSKLRNKRIELGYSQQYIADKLGVSKQTISHWEKADRNVYAKDLIDYCHAMDMTLDGLMADSKPDMASKLYDAYKKADNSTQRAIQMLLKVDL